MCGQLPPVKYEFVWGVYVLTIGKRDFVVMRGQNGHRPRVFHSFQDKEPVRQVGLYGGTPGLFGHLRGRNIYDYS